MDHGLELVSPILEIVDRTILQYCLGNIGSYDLYISPILEILDRTIHTCSSVDVAGSAGVAGGQRQRQNSILELGRQLVFPGQAGTI